MAYIIVDRRKNAKGKSTVNRQRFFKRVKEHVKEAVKDIIRDGNITDITSNKNKKINIPQKGITQPTIHHTEGGIHDIVLPGNKEYSTGDRIKRPSEGKGKGKEGSPDGEGEDDFQFQLTRDEFLEIFFEDLELPDLVKKDLATIDEWASKRAGFSVDGNPSTLNIPRSARQAKGRRFALRAPKKRKLKKLEKELEKLISIINYSQENSVDCSIEKNRKIEVEKEIKILKKKIKAIPFIDEVDLRYNRWEKYPIPTTQAVMFAIMDVSGSMGEWEKEMSKRFFMLLYLFLERNYEKVILFLFDIIHQPAKLMKKNFSILKKLEEQSFLLLFN